MEHFNYYVDFLVEFYKTTADETKPVEKSATYEEFVRKFNNSFGYNKTEIDENGYNPEINAALSKFQEFIKNNKSDDGKNPAINSIDLTSQGAASWVSTNYLNQDSYNYENNKKLAADRGSALGDRVLEDIKKYLTKLGYDINKIKFNTPKVLGTIKNEESRKVLMSFVTENFASDKKNLVAQMADAAGGKGKTNPNAQVKFFKDSNADEELKTRTEYEKNKENFEVLTLQAKNSDKIYELLSKTPAYVTFTAKLKSGSNEIKEKYKDNAQLALVKVVINAKSKTKIIEPEPEPKPDEQSGQEFNVKSIPFMKDSDKLASKTEYDYLVQILSEPKNNIKYLFLVGHSEADAELNKKVFDPTSKVRLTQKTPVRSDDKKTQLELDKKQLKLKKKAARGVKIPSQNKQTFYLEYMLEDLRFILGLERVKKVARMLKNDIGKWITPALSKYRMQGVTVGTKFGTVLANQKIVQVYVETTDGTRSNSEPNVKLFSNGFKNNTAASTSMNRMKQLGHKKPAVLYDAYMRKQQLADTVIKPTYKQMANPRNQQEARIYYNFSTSF